MLLFDGKLLLLGHGLSKNSQTSEEFEEAKVFILPIVKNKKVVNVNLLAKTLMGNPNNFIIGLTHRIIKFVFIISKSPESNK